MGIVTIKNNSVFRRIYARGRSKASRYLVCYTLPNNEAESRFGFVASKKVGHAVERNRLRRILKEIVRLNENCFQSGYDYVIIVRPAARGVGYSLLEKDLLRLVRDLG